MNGVICGATTIHNETRNDLARNISLNIDYLSELSSAERFRERKEGRTEGSIKAFIFGFSTDDCELGRVTRAPGRIARRTRVVSSMDCFH